MKLYKENENYRIIGKSIDGLVTREELIDLNKQFKELCSKEWEDLLLDIFASEEK